MPKYLYVRVSFTRARPGRGARHLSLEMLAKRGRREDLGLVLVDAEPRDFPELVEEAHRLKDSAELPGHNRKVVSEA